MELKEAKPSPERHRRVEAHRQSASSPGSADEAAERRDEGSGAFDATASWQGGAPEPGSPVLERWLAAQHDLVGDAVRSDDLVGRQIGPYAVGRPIGRGSMGVVYQARDTRLDRVVAIKVLPAGRYEAPDQARFAREARAASAIDHPNICTVHDVGEIPGGPLFLVMSYYEGETLAARLERGPLSVEEAVDVAIQVARGLHRAHGAGVIHRDIKPANIMITRDGIAKILDFGIARVNGGLGLTQPGMAIGTPTYMAPEQTRGESVDARADLWAWGVVLYEMLTGRRPFEGANAVELARATVEAEPVPVRRLRKDVPDAIAAVIRRALAKSVDARYPTARALLSDLGAGSSASSTISVIQLRSRAPRPKGWVLVAVALLFCGLGATMWWAGSHSGSVEPQTARGFEREGARALAFFWRPGNIDHAVESYQRAVSLDSTRSPAYAGLARALWRRYAADRDRVWLDQAEANARRAVELEAHLTAARVTVGLIQLDRGEQESARNAFEHVVRRDPANADAHRGLGDLAQQRGEVDEAEEAYRRALELRPRDAEIHGLLGGLYFRTGRYEAAERAFVHARDLHPEVPSGFKNVAAALHMQGRYADAARQLQHALTLGANKDVYNNLGTIYYFQGLYTESVASFRKAIELGASDYRTWGNLGDACRWTPGREAEAIEAFATAWTGLEPTLHDTPTDPVLIALGAEYRAKGGEAERAVALLDRLDDVTGVTAASLFNATQAAVAAGEVDRALAYLRASLDSGYSLEEVRGEPDLALLRRDPRYHQLITAVIAKRQAISDGPQAQTDR